MISVHPPPSAANNASSAPGSRSFRYSVPQNTQLCGWTALPVSAGGTRLGNASTCGARGQRGQRPAGGKISRRLLCDVHAVHCAQQLAFAVVAAGGRIGFVGGVGVHLPQQLFAADVPRLPARTRRGRARPPRIPHRTAFRRPAARWPGACRSRGAGGAAQTAARRPPRRPGGRPAAKAAAAAGSPRLRRLPALFPSPLHRQKPAPAARSREPRAAACGRPHSSSTVTSCPAAASAAASRRPSRGLAAAGASTASRTNKSRTPTPPDPLRNKK